MIIIYINMDKFVRHQFTHTHTLRYGLQNERKRDNERERESVIGLIGVDDLRFYF